MSTTAFRIQGTEAQFAEFEHRCKITEAMFARTLCQRFEIPLTDGNLELVAGWLSNARSMGIANHMDCGIKMERVDPDATQQPTIVCLCGSTRFMDAFRSANLQETLAGRIVLSIGCDTKSDADLLALGELTKEAKAALDELHKRKIDLADEVLILNVDDYIGDSTRSELEYARAKGKRVRWLTQSQHALLSEQEPPAVAHGPAA